MKSTVNKEQALQYILNLIFNKDKSLISKTTEAFDVSKSSVYNYLNELIDDGVIKKSDDFPYELVSKSYYFNYLNNGTLLEDTIFERDIRPLLNGYEKNIISAWRYSFTEMMNNAIEHSSSRTIKVEVSINSLSTSIIIDDDGMGIFKNIHDYMLKEKNQDLMLEDCATLLFAGKFTTAKSMHSGEGIFFTSHLMDEFFIVSDNITFTRKNLNKDKIEFKTDTQGTVVYMSLFNHSKKTTKEVFDRFSNIEDGFIKTQIPIAHFFLSGNPVSRSEARRLGELILSFKEIDLNFADVEEVGQAFCHELFILWQGRNPHIKLNIINADDDVMFMIRRVMNTK